MFNLTPYEERQLARELSIKNKKLPPGDVKAVLNSDVLQTAIQKEIDNQVTAKLLEMATTLNSNN